ncbi:hypothetical protein HY312_00690 [Candidatus Saccharibacteria bacterium]|nr:hypothetical protein [Candidatus Saccharibacteria bacterium]
MDGSIIILFAAVIIIAVLLFAVITLTKKGTTVLDVDKYRSKWLAIEQSLVRDNEPSYHMAIINGDKLLDHALQARGFKGQTMGDRMKFAKETWSNRNAVWSSHKLRNQIAHESDIRVDYDQARRALAGFKQGLKDLGAI